MIVDLAAYRARKTKTVVTQASCERRELLCVNAGLARVIPVSTAVAVAPLASPELPDIEADFASFEALAYALATQI